MGMSTYVVGYRAPDAEWKKKALAWVACIDAGVEPPDELEEFFDGQDPSEQDGCEVSIRKATTEWSGDGKAGLELDLEKLPPGVKIVRFVNSW